MNDKVILEPPGAGLPRLELLLSRTGFGALRSMLGRQQVQRWLCAETQKVLALARELPLDKMRRQVLIPRPAGLEDSSRNWSVAMVLQHLVIVDSGIGELIGALSETGAFDREVRIADVKPSPDAGPEQLACLENALATYLARLAGISDLHTAHRHAHPWFGPLDGHGWHTLAALHTLIHRRQVEAILRALGEHPRQDDSIPS